MAREAERGAREVADALPPPAALEDAARRRLEHVVSSSPTVLCSLKPEAHGLTVNWVSENVERVLGHAREEVLSPDWWPSHLHPQERERVFAELATIFSEDALVQEYRFRDRAGAYRWLHAELRLLRDDSGRPVEAVGSWSDVSARKRAEAYRATQHAVTRVLSESGSLPEAAPALLRILCENLGWAFGALWEVDPKTGQLVCRSSHHEPGPGRDEFASATRQWTPAAGIGLPGRVYATGERIWISDKSQDLHAVRAALATAAGFYSACGFPVRDGARILGVLEFLSAETREADDDLLDMMSDIGEQIGEFWRRTRRLLTAQERLRHVVSSSPAVLYTLAVTGGTLVPTWVSDNIEQVIGYRPDEVGSPDWWIDRVHPEDRERTLAKVPQLLEEGHVQREYRLRRKDGHYTWIRDEQRLLFDESGQPIEVVGSWWVIADRKVAELRLAESEEQYRLLFEKHPQPLWVFDLETLAFLDVNDAAVRHYGYSRDEFLAMTIKDIRPPEEVPGLLEVVKADEPPGSFGVWRHRTQQGKTILVEIVSSPIRFKGRNAEVVLANDVTDKTTLEAQLVQAQKMEAVGQLAGGVAHDFNNLLSVISGYASLLCDELGPRHPGATRVEHIRTAARRAADLTRQLLAFSRKQMLEPKVLDLNAIVTGVEPMLRRLIGEDVQLVTSLAEDLGQVKADPGQLEQVIVNLAVNARDAMPHGGSLILETENVELGEEDVRRHADLAAGAYVRLSASDTGQGMDGATISHIFEPFFTTKPQGKGTGLGLATVFGIVKQSGGHVAVESELGRGASFQVYLPRIAGEVAPAEPQAPAPAMPSASETVLLVEDADALRGLIGEVLDDAGYRVISVSDPEEALNVAALHDGPIHVVVTDVVMPGMSGRQLADRLHESRPETRVIYMSGYTDEAIGHHGVLEPGTHFLQKPFPATALLQKLRVALGEPQ